MGRFRENEAESMDQLLLSCVAGDSLIFDGPQSMVANCIIFLYSLISPFLKKTFIEHSVCPL